MSLSHEATLARGAAPTAPSITPSVGHSITPAASSPRVAPPAPEEDPARHIPTLDSLADYLDAAVPGFLEGDSSAALDRLCRGLNGLRECVGEVVWLEEGVPICRAHPLFGITRADPYTSRAFDKPRGYAGDAVMLDYLYQGPPAGLDPRGADLLAAIAESPNGRSILWRRDLIAAEVDRMSARTDPIRILSVACGHLPEARRSAALEGGRIREWVALDQDAESLARVAATFGEHPVQPVQASVIDLVKRRLDLGRFDFICAAGLYDYLSDRLASALTAALFDRLEPGGVLLFGNFTAENHGRAYMEAFMDWHLEYRSQTEVEGLAPADPRMVMGGFTDPWGGVAYARLVKEERPMG